jgi:hypothetical protein
MALEEHLVLSSSHGHSLVEVLVVSETLKELSADTLGLDLSTRRFDELTNTVKTHLKEKKKRWMREIRSKRWWSGGVIPDLSARSFK